MKKLLAATTLLAIAAFSQAAGIVLPPPDGDPGNDEPVTVTTYTDEVVNMSGTLPPGSSCVKLEILNSNGDVIYWKDVQADQSGNFAMQWFPQIDGTYTVNATLCDTGNALEEDVAVINVVRPDASGFVTGGGWFNQGAQRDNFGFNAQVQKNGTIKGSFEFQDRNNDLNVHSNNLDWVYAPNCVNAYFSGFCTLNGQGSYRFFVEVADHGEPGGNDMLMLWVYNPVSGALMYQYSGQLNGGNIQVHCKL